MAPLSASFTAQAQALSPSFFVFNGGPYVAATHANGTLLGPASLYPGSTTPAKPSETIVLYANGFGQTSTPVVSGSILQSGILSPLPVIKIGGVAATVQFAGLVAPGEFQFNVVVPSSLANGDQTITATYWRPDYASGNVNHDPELRAKTHTFTKECTGPGLQRDQKAIEAFFTIEPT